jgi:STE24 endopeptidase
MTCLRAIFIMSAVVVAGPVLARPAVALIVAQAQTGPSTSPTPSTDARSPASPSQTSPAVSNEAGKPVEGYSLSREKYRQAVEYARVRYRLYFVDTLYGLLILFAVLHWRIGARFRDWAEGKGSRRRVVQALIFAPLLLVTLGVLELPIDLYSQSLAIRFQQSIQGWSSWIWDWTKGGLISLLVGTLLCWVLYGVIRRSPRRWWFYFWLVSIPLIVFAVFIVPLVIDPLFYKFEPLASTQPALAQEIGQVVARAGMHIPADHMFEMLASQKLKSVNAYVTGISASKRVVVWDTTVADMTPPEVVFVFGHEMGHYVLGHIWKGILFSIAVVLSFLYLGFHSLRWAVTRWGAGWGIRAVDDWASLPVLLLLLSILTFFGSPVFNGFSRTQEHHADIYGLEVTHGLVPDSRQVAARAFQVLGEIDLSDPDPNPFIEFWLFSHPSIRDRMDFALHYDPWQPGQEPQFVK